MGTLFYLVKQGFENVWKNKLMFFASVLIVMTSMITLGIFTVVGENVNAFMSTMKQDQAIVAFVDEGVSTEKINEIEDKLKKMQGISNVTHETKEQALENARREFFDENNVDLTAGWEQSNLFTDSFSVYVEDLSNAGNISSEIEKFEGVRKVKFDNDVFSFIQRVADIIRTVVFVVFVLLIGVSLLVVSNTIKLVLHSRRREINIMKYIGATDNFVKMPFIIEGIIVGITGALLSWFLTMQLYSITQNTLIEKLGNFQAVELNMQILKMNLLIGIGVSCIACIISIKKYLKV